MVGASMTALILSQALQKLIDSDRSCFIARTDYELLALRFIEYHGDVYTESLPNLPNVPDIDRYLQFRAQHEVEEMLMLHDMTSMSLAGAIGKCMKAIRESFVDKRDPHKITYPLDVIVITILLAKLCGYNNASEISYFFKRRNLELQLIIPGMPDVKYGLSKSTINNVIAMLTYEEINKLFVDYFSCALIALDKLIVYNEEKHKDNRDATKPTLAFDGQEVRASFKRGVASRKSKGAIVVTLFNCTDKNPLDFINVPKKNNEVGAFLKLASRTNIVGSVVMCDALNTSHLVTDKIVERGANYLLPIKSYRGNKFLLAHVKNLFVDHQDITIKESFSNKDHGRIELYEFEILDAKYLNQDVKNPHKNIHTLVKCTKTVKHIRAGKVVKTTKDEKYYISSLMCNENTIKQVMASISDYWFIEQAHNLYDSSVFNQDRLQACNNNTLSTHVGFNKIVHNILAFIRQKQTEKLKKKTPIPYKIVQDIIKHSSLVTVFLYIAEYFITQVDE